MWGAGGRPARRRWCDVTASGIWGGVSGFVSGGVDCLVSGREGSAEQEGRKVVGGNGRACMGSGLGMGIGGRTIGA